MYRDRVISSEPFPNPQRILYQMEIMDSAAERRIAGHAGSEASRIHDVALEGIEMKTRSKHPTQLKLASK